MLAGSRSRSRKECELNCGENETCSIVRGNAPKRDAQNRSGFCGSGEAGMCDLERRSGSRAVVVPQQAAEKLLTADATDIRCGCGDPRPFPGVRFETRERNVTGPFGRGNSTLRVQSAQATRKRKSLSEHPRLVFEESAVPST